MSYYFGFEPSDNLKEQIATLREQVEANGSNLYEKRDTIMLGILDEIIDHLLVKLISLLDEGKKKDTMVKMTNLVRSVSHGLLKQLLGKSSNEEAKPSLDFLFNETINKNADGEDRVGFVMTPELYNAMTGSFAEVFAGNGKAICQEFVTVFNNFADACLKHFVMDFANTLKLGFIKRKAVPVAESAISKGVHMGNKDLFPQLEQEDFEDVANHYQTLIFEA